MKEFVKLLKNIFSGQPFEQYITIEFSLSIEQILFILFVVVGLLYLLLK